MKAKLGSGTPAAAENRVQEEGRGRERCGGGTHAMKTSFEEARVSLSREAPGQARRPNNSLCSVEESPGLLGGRGSHSQGCAQLC